MNFTSISDYFSAQLQKTMLPDSYLESLSTILTSSNKTHSHKIKSPKKSVNPLIQKLSPPDSSKIEEAIRKQKLKTAEFLKQELENKLLYVSQSIGELQSPSQSQLKRSLLKNSSKDLISQEKASDYSEELKKFAELRKQSEKFLKLQSEKILQRAKELEEKEAKNLEEKKRLKEEQRKEELEKFRTKRDQKTKEIENIKNSQIIGQNFLDQKPLFLKLEENFKMNFEMPELEKRKEELKKKSIYFMPIQHGAIKDHAKWYSSVKEASAQKIKKVLNSRAIDEQVRSSSLVTSSWALKLIEQEKKIEEEKELNLIKKQKLREKKSMYSEMIKEFFPVSLKKEKKESFKEKPKDAEVKVWKPHKFKSNSMVPEPKVQKKGRVFNYLEEKRKEREGRSGSPEDCKNLEKIIEKNLIKGSLTSRDLKKVEISAMRLEGLARKKESEGRKGHFTKHSFQRAADVDKMIISTIKAKLHLLENI